MYLGLAGVLPYLATSLTSVFCAWEVQTAETYGMGMLFNEAQAHAILGVLEPLQIGYGAVVCPQAYEQRNVGL